MKILLISLLILSFLGISAFSFIAMYHGGSYGIDKRCAIETATGMDCPANPFAFADFHLNLFRVFSSAPLGIFFNSYLALLTFLFFGFVFNLHGHSSLNVAKIRRTGFKQFFESFTPLVESKTSHWLSLHENSPAFIVRR